jgi:dUTP pyrophosphatase
MNRPELKVTRLASASDLPLPSYRSAGAAGLDLHAAVAAEAPMTAAPGERLLVPTGLIVAIPKGHEGQVRPRSGLALKHGLTVLNAPGTIDSDYRGELKVLLINHGDAPVTVSRGMRIAQLVVSPFAHAQVVEMSASDDLGDTDRGAGGFGSTGSG